MTTSRIRVVARPGWLAAALAVLLVGCGQRGNLYLPTPQKTTVPPAATRSADCGEPGSAAQPATAGAGCSAPAN